MKFFCCVNVFAFSIFWFSVSFSASTPSLDQILKDMNGKSFNYVAPPAGNQAKKTKFETHKAGNPKIVDRLTDSKGGVDEIFIEMLYENDGTEFKGVLKVKYKLYDQGWRFVEILAPDTDKSPFIQFEKTNSRKNDINDMYKQADSLYEKKIYPEAIEKLKEASGLGHTESAKKLGGLYYTGKDFVVPKDVKEACKLFKIAADNGDAESLYWLGGCHHNGDLGAINGNLARQFFEKSWSAGYRDAAYGLGYLYEDGAPDIEINVFKSIEWFTKAADLGDIRSMNRLGIIYITKPQQLSGAKAIEIAKKAIRLSEQNKTNPEHIARSHFVLAAGYSLVGNFKDAVRTQQTVISIINKEPELSSLLQESVDLLHMYQANKPFSKSN